MFHFSVATILYAKESVNVNIKKQCESIDSGSCLTLGLMYLMGSNGKEKNPEKGLILLEQSCRKNSAKGCHFTGEIYYSGDVAKEDDIPKAVKYYNKACDLGEGMSCFNLGVIYYFPNENKKISTNYPEAKRLFSLACDLKYVKGCRNLGVAYSRENNSNMAMLSFKRACDLGDKEACNIHEQLSSHASKSEGIKNFDHYSCSSDTYQFYSVGNEKGYKSKNESNYRKNMYKQSTCEAIVNVASVPRVFGGNSGINSHQERLNRNYKLCLIGFEHGLESERISCDEFIEKTK